MDIVLRTIHGPDKCVHHPSWPIAERYTSRYVDRSFIFSFTCLEKARQGYFRLSGHMEINCSTISE